MNEQQSQIRNVSLNSRPNIKPKPNGAEIKEAMKDLQPMLKMARERVSQLPKSLVLNELTGEMEERQFVSHAQLARILFQTCGGRLIVHPKIIKFGVQCEVVSDLMLLTRSGYIMIDSGRASANVATSMPKVLLEAESRSKRNALSILRVFCENDVTDEMNEEVDSNTEQQSNLAEKPKTKTTKTAKAAKAAKAPKELSTSSKSNSRTSIKRASKPVVEKNEPIKSRDKPSLARKGKDLTPTSEWPDKTDVRYRELLLEGVKSSKDTRFKTVPMAKFIKQVVGERGVNRLNSCGIQDLEKLFENYVINDNCPI